MVLKINGKKINSISNANNKAVIAKTEAPVRRIIDSINSVGLKHGMKINSGKTKVIKFAIGDNKEARIKI